MGLLVDLLAGLLVDLFADLSADLSADCSANCSAGSLPVSTGSSWLQLVSLFWLVWRDDLTMFTQ